MTHRAARRGFFVVILIVSRLVWPEAAHAGRIVFDAKIDGKPVRLAFDTGATHTTLFRKTADRLGLKFNPIPEETAKTAKVKFAGITEPYEFRLANEVVQAKFHVIDVPAGIVEREAEGVLGWLPLRHTVIAFDGEDASAQIGATLPDDLANWKKLRIRKAGVLQIEVPQPDGRVGVVFIDSGSHDGVQLPPDRWKEFKAKHADLPSTVAAFYLPASGLVVRNTLWAPEISLGELQLKGVPVQEAMADDAEIPDYIATLGSYSLRRMQLVIDGGEGVAYVKPSAAPPPPFAHNRLGAVFVPRDLWSDPLHARVAPASPAALAGIRDGDILKRIDDLDVTKWRTDPRVMPMSRFFERRAGTKVRLTLQRAGEEREVEVVLKDILGPS